jgi:type VI secretion system secreted protein VgrG
MPPATTTISVTTPATPKPLLFERMTGEEELGRPFWYDVDLLCESGELHLDGFLGKKMTVTVEHKKGERYFNGVCTRFRVLGGTHRYVRYRATLRPDLSLLSLASNCRIFQKKTVPAILKQMFRDKVRFDVKLARHEYRTWEYLVQYRETDFNFVSRLMEEEGIFYYFNHTVDNHELVLIDESSSCQEAPGYDRVRFLPPEERGRIKEEHIASWTAGASMVPGRFTVRNFRFDRPTDLPTSTVDSQIRRGDGGPRPGAPYEFYDYPGHHTDSDEGRSEARNRLLELESQHEIAEAQGDTRGLSAGHRFTVTDLPRMLQSDKSYIIVKASYTVHGNTYEGDGKTEAPEEFRAKYTLIDSKLEYRTPRLTEKPIVQGPQTATVVGHKNGAPGDELATDEHGRVMVKFHWDRRGDVNGPEDDPDDKDKEQSCFIRVAQSWAGTRFGGIFIPRIGQEVIVDFLEGDPDRPIITGRVYNGDNKVPWDLPANATQSGIITRSSKGATRDNANIIRFEDKKESEQLFIHAEKALDIEVEKDETHWVGHDRTKTIDNDETVHVKGHREETVDKTEAVTIGQSQTLAVGTTRDVTVGAAQTVTIAAAHNETVGASKTVTVGAALTVSVGTGMSLSVGGSGSEAVTGAKSVTVDKSSTETVKENKTVEVTKNLSETVGENIVIDGGKNISVKAGKKALIEAADELTLKAGDASIVLKKNGDITIQGAKITIKGSGDVILKGSKISQN